LITVYIDMSVLRYPTIIELGTYSWKKLRSNKRTYTHTYAHTHAAHTHARTHSHTLTHTPLTNPAQINP